MWRIDGCGEGVRLKTGGPLLRLSKTTAVRDMELQEKGCPIAIVKESEAHIVL
jgi:hypothetical protein